MAIARNTSYFWDFVVFQVEDELFKVPKQRLAENPHPPFSEIFDNGAHGNGFGNQEEGHSTEHPIVLEQIAKVDFQRFLEVLYPQPQYMDDRPLDPDTESAKWFSILRLSSLWNFLPMRKTALHNLDRLSACSFTPVECIVKGKEHGVLQWFLKGLIPLAAAHNSEISHEDARKLGVETAISLYHLKGTMRSTIRGWARLSVAREEALLGALGRGITASFANDIQYIVSRASVYQDTPLGDMSHGGSTILTVDEYEPFKCRWEIGRESQIELHRLD